MGDPGLVCLRAITTALLALYNVESTIAVLAHIIPHNLINYDLDGEQITADLPFQACLRQFVTASAKEEENHTLRKNLWKRLDEMYDKLFLASGTRFRVEDSHELEVPIVIGLLEWILSPSSKKVANCYPTRSLTAWSLSVILSHLGFDVFPSTQLIASPELYDQLTLEASLSTQARITLVVCPNKATDSSMPIPGDISVPASIPHRTIRVVPIKAAPMVLFRHVRHQCLPVDVDRLCAIWHSSFNHTRISLGQLQVLNGSDVYLPVIHRDDLPLPVCTDKVIHDLKHERTLHILHSILTRYFPNHRWSSGELKDFLSSHNVSVDPQFGYHNCEIQVNSPSSAREIEEWYTLTAILLGTLYAAWSKSLQLSDDDDCATTEVAVDADFVTDFRKKKPELYEWFFLLQRAITSGVSIELWSRMVTRALTGNPQQPMRKNNSQVLGYHKNGIFLFADFLIRPSLRLESLALFHVHSGQPLQVPVSEHGCITSDIDGTGVASYSFNTDNIPVIDSLNHKNSDSIVRLDVEPWWEGDSRQVIFRVRSNGVLYCSFSVWRLHDILNSQSISVKCLCRRSSDAAEITPVPGTLQSWKALEVSQLLSFCKSAALNGPDIQLAPANSTLFCVHASGDIGSQLFSLVCWSGRVIFTSICIPCAVRRMTPGSLLVMGRDEDSTPLEQSP